MKVATTCHQHVFMHVFVRAASVISMPNSQFQAAVQPVLGSKSRFMNSIVAFSPFNPFRLVGFALKPRFAILN